MVDRKETPERTMQPSPPLPLAGSGEGEDTAGDKRKNYAREAADLWVIPIQVKLIAKSASIELK